MRADALLSLLGAIALGAGCVLRFSSDGTAVKLICTLGVVGALALLASGVLRLKQDAPPAMLYVPAILYYRCARSFRLPPLDARSGNSGLLLLSVRADLLHDRNLSRAASFSFDHGARRRLCFYSLCGVFFGATAMAGQALSMLIYAKARAASCLTYSMQALGTGKWRKKASFLPKIAPDAHNFCAGGAKFHTGSAERYVYP